MLIPDLRAGCSLAASISAEDVRQLRRRYPGVPVVSYVNTSADVKAASDICCTSGNALRVVESLGSERVIFVPDRVVLDDVGFADLGCYGAQYNTAFIDEIAAGGTRFNNFHVTALCAPTRACLLTGRNAHAGCGGREQRAQQRHSDQPIG